MEYLDTNIVKVVEESAPGLNLIGKAITHKTTGKGIVVGYSSVTGEPFAFFYNEQVITDRVCCFYILKLFRRNSFSIFCNKNH